MHIGASEIIVVLVLFFLLFGARKLPDEARSLARSLKIFKHEMKNISEELDSTEDNGKEKEE
ncbi:MAG: twin-arginine translocase TatA/TatE family subunit [Spirochaetota bacterium]|nr:twin-arginine translocase TatA/TatE family subunit [Spirochaetota bacterium]